MQKQVNQQWQATLSGSTYTLVNTGHAIDRHSIMNPDQCAIRARLSNNTATSFLNEDTMDKAIGQAWLAAVNSSSGSDPQKGIYACSVFTGGWTDQTICTTRKFDKVWLVFNKQKGSGNVYELTTAYPSG